MKSNLNCLINSSKGSAIIQSLMLVMMVGLVAVSVGEYTEFSNTTLEFSRNDLNRTGVADLYAGVLKTNAFCNPTYIDLDVNSDGVFNDDIGTDAFITGTAIPTNLRFPMQVRLPHYDNAMTTFPVTPALSDPMLNDFALAVGNLTMRFTGIVPGSPGSYLAEVSAGFLTKRGLFSSTLSAAGQRRVATIMITRDGSTDQFSSCIVQGTAAEFCQDDLGCQYLRDSNGIESCVCGLDSTITCPGPDDYLNRVLANGAPDCQTWPPAVCPVNQYLVKINANGSLDCRVWPYNHCEAAAGSIPWRHNGGGLPAIACTNSNIIKIPPGETWAIGDFDSSGGTPVGRAYFSCPYPSAGVPDPAPQLEPHSLATPQECY